MNSRPFHRRTIGSVLPPLLAASVLCMGGVLCIKSSQPHPATGLAAPPRAASAPVEAAASEPALAKAHPLSGVLSLPPAMLPGTVTAQTITRHQPPPPASREAFTFADLKSQMPQRADGTFLMEIPTLYFSAGDAAARQVIEGQNVETTAQFRRAGTGIAAPRLTRRLTRCCSADAQEFCITAAEPARLPAFAEGTWVKAMGRMQYRREVGGFGAVLEIATISEVPPPATPVLQ